MASLPPCLKSSLKEIRRDRIDPVYGLESIFIGWQIVGHVEPDDLTAGQSMVAASMSPASREVIVSELTRLRVLTLGKNETEDRFRLMTRAYVEEMGKYPPDVVRAACRSWAKTGKFWPSWSELSGKLDAELRNRKSLAKTLGVSR